MAQLVSINKVLRKHYVEHKNNLIEITKTKNIEHYDKSTVVYEYKLAKGAKAGQSEYWVKSTDYVSPTRESSDERKANELESMFNTGMTPEQVVAEFKRRAQEKQASKEAK